MKKIILLLSLILLTTLVSAEVNMSFSANSAVLHPNNTLTISTPTSGYDIYAIVCTDTSCNSSSSELFPGTLNSGTSSEFNTTLPISLQGAGYGFYFTKPGYLPYEIFTDYAGSGNAPVQSVVLAKNEICQINYTLQNISYSSGNILIDVNITSPFKNSGPLNLIPTSLLSYYQSPATLNAKVLELSTSQTNSQNLLPSESQTIHFTFPASQGNYTINLNSSISDSRCLSSTNILSSISFNTTSPSVPSGNQTNTTDITPPSQISGLTAINKGPNFITWTWNNPSDLDFSHVNLFLNDIFLANTSQNIYNVTGLSPNTFYTLKVYTVDNSSNINPVPASNTQLTLSSSSGNQTNGTDTIPPAQISNLTASSVTNNSITWTWINPNDADFNSTIIFINGINVINTSSTTYTASNLIPNTNYTITVFTKDNSSNINSIPVSLTTSTLLSGTTNNSGDNNSNTSDDDKDKGEINRRIILNAPEDKKKSYPTYSTDDEIKMTDKKESSSNNSLYLLILFFINVLLLLLILLFLLSKRRKVKK